MPDTAPEHAPYTDGNREWWDSVVPIHEASRGYNREGFLRGEKQLCPVELDEFAPLVAGKSLLHLQCHFGMDTLGWARLGATVTGLDFSEPAIEAARRLSEDSGVPGTFVHANIYDAPQALGGEQFELVYTGIGALCWLPDIRAWAQVVAACLQPRGRFYIYEGHPMLWTMDDERKDNELVSKAPYFERTEPSAYSSDETYVDGPKLEKRTTYEWNHGLGEIATALIEAGLRIDFIHEHRDLPWKALHFMEPSEGTRTVDGRYTVGRTWHLPESHAALLPLSYSILATRNATKTGG